MEERGGRTRVCAQAESGRRWEGPASPLERGRGRAAAVKRPGPGGDWQAVARQPSGLAPGGK